MLCAFARVTPKNDLNRLNDLNVLNFLLESATFPKVQKLFRLHRKQYA